MPLTKIDDRGLTTPIDLLDNEKIRLGTGNDVEIYFNGNQSVINSQTNNLLLFSDTAIQISSTAGSKYFKGQSGAAELYYSDSKKLETVNTGVVISGKLETTGFLSVAADNQDLKVGAGDDIKIFHDGTDSYLQNATGDLYIQTTGSGDDIFISAVDDVQINVGGETAAKFIDDGAVELYHNNTKKFETTSSGVDITGNCTITGNFRGNDNVKLNLGNGDDLQIYHDGTNTHIKNDTNALILRSNALRCNNNGNTETMIKADADGAVELYYDNNKTAFTSLDAWNVYGRSANSGMIEIASNQGANNNDRFQIHKTSGSSTLAIRNYASGSWETNLAAVGEGAIELYHDNVKRLETTSTGNLSTGVHKFITGSGSTASDDNVVHIVAGSTASRGMMLGTGRASGASQNDGMGFIDAINSESNGYGSQLQLRVDGQAVMYVGYNSNDFVGIGTGNIASKLHVKDSNTGSLSVDSYPTLTLETGATSGSGNTGTGIIFLNHNGNTNGGTFGGSIQCLKSNNNVGDTSNYLRFSTRSNGGSVKSAFEIAGSGVNSSLSSTHCHQTLTEAGSGTSNFLYRGHHSSGSTISFNVWSNGNVQNINNSYGSLSDLKLKENIVDANSQWNDIKAIKIRNYNFKAETGQATHTQIGCIAQEVETVSPKLVYESPDMNKDAEDLGTTTKSINYSVLYMKGLKALQEAMAKIEVLEAKVAALEAA